MMRTDRNHVGIYTAIIDEPGNYAQEISAVSFNFSARSLVDYLKSRVVMPFQEIANPHHAQ